MNRYKKNQRSGRQNSIAMKCVMHVATSLSGSMRERDQNIDLVRRKTCRYETWGANSKVG